MFIRSRYDILLGRPGREIVEEPKPFIDEEHIIVYGPRRSGRTRALVEDMLNFSRMGNNTCCFISQNQAQNDTVRRQIPRMLYNGVFLTYSNPQALRGLDADGLYLDDFIRSPEDFSHGLKFLDMVRPYFCHGIRIVIASIIKEMPFDTTSWTFRELTVSF